VNSPYGAINVIQKSGEQNIFRVEFLLHPFFCDNIIKTNGIRLIASADYFYWEM
jgi:hypothetical protein